MCAHVVIHMNSSTCVRSDVGEGAINLDVDPMPASQRLPGFHF